MINNACLKIATIILKNYNKTKCYKRNIIYNVQEQQNEAANNYIYIYG